MNSRKLICSWVIFVCVVGWFQPVFCFSIVECITQSMRRAWTNISIVKLMHPVSLAYPVWSKWILKCKLMPTSVITINKHYRLGILRSFNLCQSFHSWSAVCFITCLDCRYAQDVNQAWHQLYLYLWGLLGLHRCAFSTAALPQNAKFPGNGTTYDPLTCPKPSYKIGKTQGQSPV